MITAVVTLLAIIATAAIGSSGYRVFITRKNLRTQRKIAMYNIELAIHQRIAAVGGLDEFLEFDARDCLDKHGRTKTGLDMSPEEAKFGNDALETVNRQIEEYRQLDCKEVAGVATAGTMGVGVGLISALIEIGVIGTVIITSPAAIAIATGIAAVLAFAIFYGVRRYRGREVARFFSKDVNDMLMNYSTRDKGKLEELTKAFNEERRKHSAIIGRRYIRSIQRQIAEEAEKTAEKGAEVVDEEVMADLDQLQEAMQVLKQNKDTGPQKQAGADCEVMQQLPHTRKMEANPPGGDIRSAINPKDDQPGFVKQHKVFRRWRDKIHNKPSEDSLEEKAKPKRAGIKARRHREKITVPR